MTKGKKRFRSAFCTLLSFILALALTLVCILCVVRVTVLNSGFTAFVAERSGYISATHEELKEEFISYGSACNIDESFFDKVFDTVITEQVIADYTKHSISEFYLGTNYDMVTAEIEEQLLEELKLYAQEKGFVLDEELNNNLETMSSEMGGILKAFTGMFNSSYFKTASGVLSRYMPLFKWVLIGLLVVALLAILEIRMFFSRARNYLRHYIYATSGATLMLAVGPAVALITKIGSRINVANASLYGLVTGMINGLLTALLLAAAVMAVITVVLIVVRRNRIKRHSHHHHEEET